MRPLTFGSFYLVLLLFLVLRNGAEANICETLHFDEMRKERENSFTNISYVLNIINGSDNSVTFTVLFEVCEERRIALFCTFLLKKQSNNKLNTVNWSPGNETTCFAQFLNHSNSFHTVEIQFFLLVKRSFNMMMLSLTESKDIVKPLRLIRLEVVYHPKVNSLTVDGHELSGDYLIDEGQEVTVACFFEKGSLLTESRMMINNGQVIKRTAGDGNISHSFAVKCEDDWPFIVCEGEGSEYNRSVTFLVRCPPQFVENLMHIANPSEFDTKKFRVKAHTAAVDTCLLTPLSSEYSTVREVNCTLSRSQHLFVLNLQLEKEFTFIQGKWMLLLRNQKGTAKTTLIVESPNRTSDANRRIFCDSASYFGRLPGTKKLLTRGFSLKVGHGRSPRGAFA